MLSVCVAIMVHGSQRKASNHLASKANGVWGNTSRRASVSNCRALWAPPSTAPGYFSRTRVCARRGKRHTGVVNSRPPSAPPHSLSGHVFVPAPGPDWLSGFSHLGSFIHSANKHLVTVYTRGTALWVLGHHGESVRLSFPGAAKAAGVWWWGGAVATNTGNVRDHTCSGGAGCRASSPSRVTGRPSGHVPRTQSPATRGPETGPQTGAVKGTPLTQV